VRVEGVEGLADVGPEEDRLEALDPARLGQRGDRRGRLRVGRPLGVDLVVVAAVGAVAQQLAVVREVPREGRAALGELGEVAVADRGIRRRGQRDLVAAVGLHVGLEVVDRVDRGQIASGDRRGRRVDARRAGQADDGHDHQQREHRPEGGEQLGTNGKTHGGLLGKAGAASPHLGCRDRPSRPRMEKFLNKIPRSRDAVGTGEHVSDARGVFRARARRRRGDNCVCNNGRE